ncbi:MAG: 16S rRNA (cytosine(967)-C(5))-methyltransferase RsmB [Clostridia bacterium]|nr:16S rRNA (cytosine(967)-C(5))-methyltransferase RsmB [Clostridia bacterium]
MTRKIAMQILYEIEVKGAYSNIALNNALKQNKDLKSVDKALITRIVYGVISQKLALEEIIKKYSKIRLKKISTYILIILKIGIYQIKYMDKIPDSAAVNECVKLAKRYGHGASAGFVNGLLRSVIRDGGEIENNNLAIKYSFPEEIAKKWCNDLGEEFTHKLMESLNEVAQTYVRINSLKTSKKAVLERYKEFEESQIYNNSLIFKGTDITSSDAYKKGYIYPQDISASLASVVLNPQIGEKVLDLCSAPGGKTTHIAELMGNIGEVVACDIHAHKIDLIEKNCQRLGIDIVNTACYDSTVFNKRFENCFNKVLCDVPCSGWGIIRKKPEIKWNNDKIEDIIKISREILTNASKYVKIGGELVFSTCTLNKDENEEQLKSFLETNKNFETVDITEFLPDSLRHDSAKQGYVTFYPHIDKIDGFFIAKVKRCR